MMEEMVTSWVRLSSSSSSVGGKRERDVLRGEG